MLVKGKGFRDPQAVQYDEAGAIREAEGFVFVSSEDAPGLLLNFRRDVDDLHNSAPLNGLAEVYSLVAQVNTQPGVRLIQHKVCGDERQALGFDGVTIAQRLCI
jgi:hypothetical protein